MDATRAQATILCTFLAMAGASWQLWQIARKRRRNPVNWSPLITILPMIALALLSDSVSEPLDRALGLNNFSWYMGYSIGVLTCCIVMVLAAQEEIDEQRQRTSMIFLAAGGIALLGMTVIYMLSLRHSPEWIRRTPRNWVELIFSLAFFLYGTVFTAWGFPRSRALVGREANPIVRLRLQIAFGSNLTAHLFFLSKVLYLLLSYWLGGMRWLNHFSLLMMALTGWVWLLGNLPAVVLRILILNGPLHIYREIRLLYDLECLNARLQQFVPPLSPARPTPRIERTRHRTRYIYRTTIAILDAKKILHDYITHPVATRSGSSRVSWSPEQTKEATLLHTALCTLDDTPGDTLTSVASTLQVIARRLRQSS